MIRVVPAVCLLAAATACGASNKAVREARQATYDVPFPTVWNAVTEEIHKRFPTVQVEDPVTGTVITGYLQIESGADQVADQTAVVTGPSGTQVQKLAPGQTPYGQTAFTAFRMVVNVKPVERKGGPPWRVIVDGEAAQYEPGMAQIIPIKHGQADEPPWVASRINRMTIEIHERLRAHAVKRGGPVAKEQIASKTFDTTPWANLPDRAASAVIGKVHRAAVARDTSALRPTMSDDFRWALGADGSADTAVAMWSADPTKLKALAITLEDGCAAEPDTGEVVCPAKGAGPAMARFRKVGPDWKFTVFLVK
jgi:hypothetical protein